MFVTKCVCQARSWLGNGVPELQNEKNFYVSVKHNHGYVMGCPRYKVRNICVSVKQNHGSVMGCPCFKRRNFVFRSCKNQDHGF